MPCNRAERSKLKRKSRKEGEEEVILDSSLEGSSDDSSAPGDDVFLRKAQVAFFQAVTCLYTRISRSHA
jgi:hypothetical protein